MSGNYLILKLKEVDLPRKDPSLAAQDALFVTKPKLPTKAEKVSPIVRKQLETIKESLNEFSLGNSAVVAEEDSLKLPQSGQLPHKYSFSQEDPTA